MNDIEGNEIETVDKEGKNLHELISSMSETEKYQHLAYFLLFLQSPRFTDFIKNNYDIHQELDDEKKVVQLAVLERPISVGPRLSPTQLFKLQGLLASHGVQDVVACYNSLLKVLGQDSSPIITPSEAANLKLV